MANARFVRFRQKESWLKNLWDFTCLEIEKKMVPNILWFWDRFEPKIKFSKKTLFYVTFFGLYLTAEGKNAMTNARFVRFRSSRVGLKKIS